MTDRVSYVANIVKEVQDAAVVWHVVVQLQDGTQVILWSQESSREMALHLATECLEKLSIMARNRSMTPGGSVAF